MFALLNYDWSIRLGFCPTLLQHPFLWQTAPSCSSKLTPHSGSLLRKHFVNQCTKRLILSVVGRVPKANAKDFTQKTRCWSFIHTYMVICNMLYASVQVKNCHLSPLALGRDWARQMPNQKESSRFGGRIQNGQRKRLQVHAKDKDVSTNTNWILMEKRDQRRLRGALDNLKD